MQRITIQSLAITLTIVSVVAAQETIPLAPADPTSPVQQSASVQADISESVDQAIANALALTDVESEQKRKIAPFLATAKTALQRFDKEITDYTCVMIKRERVQGTLSGHQYVWMKVREPRRDGDEVTTPLSLYLRFLKPQSLAGREILYVDGERGGDMLARRGGPRLPNLTFLIDPKSRMAMRESRYPVTQAGIRFLLEELISRMETELTNTACEINERDAAKMDGRPCRHFEVRQLERRPGLDYQVAHVLLDEELRLPVYFASYAWSEEPGGEPELQEEYIFTRLTLNPGLTDADFQRDNPDYKFPAKEDSPSDELKAETVAPEEVEQS